MIDGSFVRHRLQGRSIKDIQASGCVCPSDERMVKALSAAGQQTNLNSLKNLERLDASRKQQVTDQEGQALVWAVASHTTNSLQELILACTDVGDLTCKAIGQLLRYYSSLTMVDLHDNAITDEGAIVLANSLRFNRHQSPRLSITLILKSLLPTLSFRASSAKPSIL